MTYTFLLPRARCTRYPICLRFGPQTRHEPGVEVRPCIEPAKEGQ